MALCVPPTDWGCLAPEVLADLDPVKKARAEALAWDSLVRLTGQRLSLCSISVRPCAARIFPWGEYLSGSGLSGSYTPYVAAGVWYNACGCVGAEGCGCDSSRVIRLRGEVGGPVSVLIDGAALDPSAYRIDNGNLLVRQDGGVWPLSQDMNAPAGDPNTFLVSYYPGVGPDPQLAFAAGLLAVEWYAACNGGECKLPAGVTQVVRQGVTFTIPAGVFDDGLTGIREVDAITGMYNPNRLRTPPRVLSPDRIMRNRMRTA